MPGAPKGNKNALKHGLYAEKALAVEVIAPPSARAGGERSEALRGPTTVVLYLEEVADAIFARMKQADGDEFPKLANALSLLATAMFNGYRTVAYLTGGLSPVEDAIRELEALDFSED